MPSRRLIESSSYTPDQIKAMTQAFDKAWEIIKGKQGRTQHSIASARLRLANAVLAAAKLNTTDVEALKNEALQIMESASRTGGQNSN